MGIRAEAVPLEQPLEGGVKGAAASVEPISTGTAIFPGAFFERVPGRLAVLKAFGVGTSRDDYNRLPIPVFLIRHPGAGAILVDTGLHGSAATDPKQSMGRLQGPYFEQERGQDAVSQLRERGLSPGDIKLVVMTHLHGDHASAMSEFTDATFVCSSAEWQAVNDVRLPFMHGYIPAHYDLGVDYRTVDFDGDAIDSYGPLGRTFDLLGDGSIRLAFTPGHTAGHMSVIVRLPKRDFVIAGDAAYTWRQLEGGPEPYWVDDAHNWRRSIRELQAYRKRYPHAIVVPGHDAALFEKLDARYEA